MKTDERSTCPCLQSSVPPEPVSLTRPSRPKPRSAVAGPLADGEAGPGAPGLRRRDRAEVMKNPRDPENNTWRASCFVHVDDASFHMTRTLQSIRSTVRTSSTKAVQQHRCAWMRPVVARWSKLTDAGCLA